jgi:hypothetical protein
MSLFPFCRWTLWGVLSQATCCNWGVNLWAWICVWAKIWLTLGPSLLLTRFHFLTKTWDIYDVVRGSIPKSKRKSSGHQAFTFHHSLDEMWQLQTQVSKSCQVTWFSLNHIDLYSWAPSQLHWPGKEFTLSELYSYQQHGRVLGSYKEGNIWRGPWFSFFTDLLTPSTHMAL